MRKDELDRRLEDAYREMSEEFRAEVAEWDHTSVEAWQRAYADEDKRKERKKHESSAK